MALGFGTELVAVIYCVGCLIDLHHFTNSFEEKIEMAKGDQYNSGGSQDYYKLPPKARELQDLIEYKNMNFAQGNIFKATYRVNGAHHSSYKRDLEKIIWFAKRELKRIEKS